MHRTDRLTSAIAAALLALAVLACNLSRQPSSSNAPSLTNAPAVNSPANQNVASAGEPSAGGSGSTANSDIVVEEINLALDNQGEAGEIVEGFSPADRTIHFLVRLNEARKGVNVRVTLTAADVQGTTNEKLKELTRETGQFDRELDSQFSYPEDWPAGMYRVDVFIDDRLAKARQFEIR